MIRPVIIINCARLIGFEFSQCIPDDLRQCLVVAGLNGPDQKIIHLHW